MSSKTTKPTKPTKNQKRFVRFKSEEWFKKNGWEDFDYDWWPSKEVYEKWEMSSEDENHILSQWIHWEDIGKIVDYDGYVNTNPSWGIEEEISEEEYPEYWL